MYDYYDDDDGSDYSFEYSDYEYNTLEPYNFELNNFKVEIKETSEDKLLKFIHDNEISEIKSLIPSLLVEVEKSNHIQNGDDANISKSVNESGDAASDNSFDESSEDEDETRCDSVSHSKYNEIFFKNGDTPLMVAATEGKIQMVSYFLSLGFDVNFKLPNSNKTALLALFMKSNSNTWSDNKNRDYVDGLVKCLQAIIDAGGDVKARGFISTSDYGNTALHYAVQNDYWEMLEMLIHAGGDIDATNNQKQSPLQISASKGHVSCCNILLLAGANAKLIDKSGNTAADLAELEGFHHLSDAINVYCGHAQHNVRLYKTWRQYAPRIKNADLDSSFTETGNSMAHNHSSIESFCLSLNAPYLIKLMEEQGISITDLKFMDEPKLKELGVPENDCKKVMTAMKDLNKRSKGSSKKIDFAYGKPLKPITMLEMMGNIGEHTEFIDTNLEAMLFHLLRNEKFYLEKCRIVSKSTVDNLKSNSTNCIEITERVIKQTDRLKGIISQHQNQGDSDTITDDENSSAINVNVKSNGGMKNYVGLRTSIFVTSIIAVSLSVVMLSKRFL